VEPRANNVLSCVVRWTTDSPATTELTATEQGGESFVWTDEQPSTDHEVWVLGLREQSLHSLEAVSRDLDGDIVWLADGSFESGQLPFPMPMVTRTAHDPDRVQPGWTLTSFLVDSDLDHRAAVLLDEEGAVRWYHEFDSMGAMAAVQVSRVEGGEHVLVGPLPDEGQRPFEVTLAGELVWEGPEQPALGLSGYMHHTLQKLSGGDYLALTYDYVEGDQIDVIEQIDADGTVAWRWDSGALVAELGSGLWANAVQVDLEAGTVYVNSRMHSLLFRVDRASGDVVWSLGADGDFTAVGGHTDPWFSGAHATTRLPDGNVLAYDNGNGARDYSRAIEYALDEEAHTAEVVWEFPGALAEVDWYTSVWGDVDRLANGNTLITAGSMIAGDSTSQIFEVTREGQVVWGLEVEGVAPDERAGVYGSERVDPLVSPLPAAASAASRSIRSEAEHST
jgi:hypothetical protein